MFYIYENWQAGPHKAVLHHGSCGFCKNGKGLSGGTDKRFGKWHGSFQDLKKARAASRQLNVQVRKDCTCISRNN